ncbi:MAG TPA: ImmA/IrrE family metallo-endopeptidase [Anaerolineales bacterium]|nr:ImmA/IrrE family metallo-endopeptidase [Anaerolineales bacterium]
MNPITREERHWFLHCLAQGLYEYMGAAAPPIPVEGLLQHPPDVYRDDFGVVDMYSTLWDATFARPPNGRGSVFVRIDLSPAERRLALARELLSALITSRHGRGMGLVQLLMADLKDSAEYFARCLVVPEPLFRAFRRREGKLADLAEAFGIPAGAAQLRWEDSPAQ